MAKISKLTPEQEAALPKYAEVGIRIGLATDDSSPFDEKEVRTLTDAHREICGVPKAAHFIVLPSPLAAISDKRFRGLTASNALYGQHDINWLMYYAFFRIECGLHAETDQIVHLLELAKRTGWMWMSSNTTIVTRRPAEIHLQPKAEGPAVLHNTKGYALRWLDGTGICVVSGIRIPEEYEKYILSPDREGKDLRKIMSIGNTEVRGAILRTRDMRKVFGHLNAQLVETATVQNGGRYKLYSLDMGTGPRLYLSGICPSKGDDWYEAVPPECTTVEKALTWREWGRIDVPYLTPMVRT